MYRMFVRDSRVWTSVLHDNWISHPPHQPLFLLSAAVGVPKSYFPHVWWDNQNAQGVQRMQRGDWLRRHVWHGLANNKHLSSCHLFTSASFIKISLTFHTKFNLIDGRGRATPTHWLTLPYDRRLLYFQLTWNLLFTQLCLAHEQAAKTEIRLVLFMHISALELSPVWTRETLWSQVVYSIDIQPD